MFDELTGNINSYWNNCRAEKRFGIITIHSTKTSRHVTLQKNNPSGMKIELYENKSFINSTVIILETDWKNPYKVKDNISNLIKGFNFKNTIQNYLNNDAKPNETIAKFSK